MLSVYAGAHPDRLGEVAGVLGDVLADVAENGLTEAEVARGIGQLRGGLVLGLEDSGSRMSRIGKGELNYSRPPQRRGDAAADRVGDRGGCGAARA